MSVPAVAVTNNLRSLGQRACLNPKASIGKQQSTHKLWDSLLGNPPDNTTCTSLRAYCVWRPLLTSLGKAIMCLLDAPHQVVQQLPYYTQNWNVSLRNHRNQRSQNVGWLPRIYGIPSMPWILDWFVSLGFVSSNRISWFAWTHRPSRYVSHSLARVRHF